MFFDSFTVDMKLPYWILFSCLFLAFSLGLQAQEKPEGKLVQFTGIIKDDTSNFPVPYVSITNVSYQNQFFTANYQGFFSFVAHEGDTIQLSSVGYRSAEIVIPRTDNNKYTAIIKMNADIISLPAVHLLPWASIEEFNIAFMNIKIASDDILLAKQNLSRESLMAMAREVPMDANEINTFTSNQNHIKLSNEHINQRANNPLLNPFAWGKFINSIQKGKESRKKY